MNSVKIVEEFWERVWNAHNPVAIDGLIGGATGLLVVGVFPRSSRPGSPSL